MRNLLEDPPAEDALTKWLLTLALDMAAIAGIAAGFAWLTRKKVEAA